MSGGELLTRGSVWLALIAYAIGAGMMLRVRGRAAARCVWTIGCALFLVHVVCAFGFYHGWSHAAALDATARQTGEMTGVRWGGGLFLNYVFALAWLGDVLWWWLAPESHARRSQRLAAVWHGFFFFMVFNGAVVFANGPVRWLGLVICGGVAGLWLRSVAVGARAR